MCLLFCLLLLLVLVLLVLVLLVLVLVLVLLCSQVAVWWLHSIRFCGSLLRPLRRALQPRRLHQLL
jgi:hypothetical protein